jgi:hypothetical protein
MNRRKFIKCGSLFIPMIFVPKLIRAQGFTYKDPAFLGNAKKRVSGGGGGGGCTTIKDSFTPAVENATFIANVVGNTYWGTFFLAASSYTLCAFDLDIFKILSPTMDVTPSIWSVSAGKPGTNLGSGTLVSATTFPTAGGTFYKFGGLNVAITNGTYYFLVLYSSAVDAGNYFKCNINATNAVYPFFTESQASVDGTTWTTVGNSEGLFHTYA